MDERDFQAHMDRCQAALGGAQERIRSARKELAEAPGLVPTTRPFASGVIRQWFVEGARGFCDGACTAGSGPIEESDLDALLKEHDVELSQLGHDLARVIVGRTDVDLEDLEAHIGTRRGQTLRVYSQEMALMYLWSGRDPLEAPREVLDEFREGHPVLEYLASRPDDGFRWPGTEVGEAVAG